MDELKRNECNNWQSWSVERFCKELNEAVPNVTEAQAQIMGFEETISRVMVNFDLQDTSLEDETDQLLSDIMDAHPNISTASQLAAVSILRKRLPDTPTNWRSILSRKVDCIEPKFNTVEAFRFVWLNQLKICREHIATVVPSLKTLHLANINRRLRVYFLLRTLLSLSVLVMMIQLLPCVLAVVVLVIHDLPVYSLHLNISIRVVASI